MTYPQERKKGSINVHVGAANVPGDLGGKPFLVKDTAGESTCRPPLDAEQRGLIVPENLLLQIKDMAEELDMLLECIDEPGGFRDACTVFLRSSEVEALEEGMGTLSENCRMLKVIFHCNGSLLFLGSAIMYHYQL
ncbi:hypothetical protein NC653_000153 [Populus alba x Populus x berolinensis]|uniref:Uncharacterized protein n=1 Tax=Populus alba x Populus x berolinensis TaxID=444605 RepID=A0AAD6RI00_9ROSI|nr:hypothetical protein NC653_000153 [Populus alba x Populus x berolinensis]